MFCPVWTCKLITGDLDQKSHQKVDPVEQDEEWRSPNESLTDRKALTASQLQPSSLPFQV